MIDESRREAQDMLDAGFGIMGSFKKQSDLLKVINIFIYLILIV